MATLHIVQGFIGAGKTHFSKALAARTGALRLNADEKVANDFPPAAYEADWDGCFAQAVDAIWQDTRKLLADGRDVILDLGFWTRESRDHARRQASTCQAAFRHYFIDTPDALLLERMQARGGAIAAANIRNFQTLRAQFEAPRDDETPVIIKPDTEWT